MSKVKLSPRIATNQSPNSLLEKSRASAKGVFFYSKVYGPPEIPQQSQNVLKLPLAAVKNDKTSDYDEALSDFSSEVNSFDDLPIANSAKKERLEALNKNQDSLNISLRKETIQIKDKQA